VALVMALYYRLAFKAASPVRIPEKLYREAHLMLGFVATVVVMLGLLFVRLPWW